MQKKMDCRIEILIDHEGNKTYRNYCKLYVEDGSDKYFKGCPGHPNPVSNANVDAWADSILASCKTDHNI